MATVNEIVSGALKLLGIRAAESPLTAAEAEDGRVSLNDMMAEWEERSIYTGFVALADVDDPVLVPDYAIGAIKSNLAIYIAPEYGKSIAPELDRRASKSFTALKAALIRMGPSSFPDTLPVGSGNQVGFTSSDGDVPGLDNEMFYPENEKRNF